MTTLALSTPPSSPAAALGQWLFGSYLDLRRDNLGTFLRLAESGEAVRFRALHQVMHLLPRPEHVEHVLVTHARKYRKQTSGYRQMRNVVGNGLLTSEGDFWRRQRRLAQPAFHRQRLAGFGEIMTRVGEETVARWRAGEAIDISREMMRATLRIVSLALLSTDTAESADKVGSALTTALEHVVHRMFVPWSLPESIPTPQNRRFRRAMDALDGVVGGIIAERRRTGEEHGDMLDLLMGATDPETGGAMTDAQLRDEVMTIFLAGHETTAMTLTWTLHLLATNPDVERALRQELQLLGGRTPTLHDLPSLPLSERVVLESMRLYPPAWVVARSVAEDDEIGGHRVRRGERVFMSPWVTHRQPDLWPNPNLFDADRFLPEQIERRPKLAYFPFSFGQRKCIGDQFAMMEARLLLVTILQRARLSRASDAEPVLEPLVTLRPRGGLAMRVEAVAS